MRQQSNFRSLFMPHLFAASFAMAEPMNPEPPKTIRSDIFSQKAIYAQSTLDMDITCAAVSNFETVKCQGDGQPDPTAKTHHDLLMRSDCWIAVGPLR